MSESISSETYTDIINYLLTLYKIGRLSPYTYLKLREALDNGLPLDRVKNLYPPLNSAVFNGKPLS